VVVWTAVLVREMADGEVVRLSLGDPLVDDHLRLVRARARPNTWLAVAYDLKVFFAVVNKSPVQVTSGDVFDFISHQRGSGDVVVVRLADGEHGLVARTIKRRLSSVAGFYGYLMTREDLAVTKCPVPRGLPTRRPSQRRSSELTALVRTPRTLPRVLAPAEVSALLAALRCERDRAMIAAMLLAGLRRCEVLGLRLRDVRPGERRLFIAEGKGGHQRLVSVSPVFFQALGRYLETERPQPCTKGRLFVSLAGPRRGQPLSAAGVDDLLSTACRRAELTRRVSCHQLRHTCFTRLREAGMPLEAIQAQAGHRSVETTRVYLHLADGWVANEYWKALEQIDVDLEGHQSPTDPANTP